MRGPDCDIQGFLHTFCFIQVHSKHNNDSDAQCCSQNAHNPTTGTTILICCCWAAPCAHTLLSRVCCWPCSTPRSDISQIQLWAIHFFDLSHPGMSDRTDREGNWKESTQQVNGSFAALQEGFRQTCIQTLFITGPTVGKQSELNSVKPLMCQASAQPAPTTNYYLNNIESSWLQWLQL